MFSSLHICRLPPPSRKFVAWLFAGCIEEHSSVGRLVHLRVRPVLKPLVTAGTPIRSEAVAGNRPGAVKTHSLDLRCYAAGVDETAHDEARHDLFVFLHACALPACIMCLLTWRSDPAGLEEPSECARAA